LADPEDSIFLVYLQNHCRRPLDFSKRIVEKVELAQNLARENIQRSQQKMKEYYDRNASQPLFEIGQHVWVYTPKTKKGLSKKLLYNWFG